MNEKNKSASNAKLNNKEEVKLNAQASESGKESVSDSELELQELLRKYLPEYVEKETKAQDDTNVSDEQPAANEEITDDAAEISGEETDDLFEGNKVAEEFFAPKADPFVEMQAEPEKPKKKGLFSRFLKKKEKEETQAPDTELFNRLTEAAENSENVTVHAPGVTASYSEEYIAAPAEETPAVPAEETAFAEPEEPENVPAEETVQAPAEEDAAAPTEEDPSELPSEVPAETAEQVVPAAPPAAGTEADAYADYTAYTPYTEQAAGETSAPETEREVDATEENLYVAWGMEDQLDKKAGVGTADKVAARNDAEARIIEEKKRRALEYEYTERVQTPRIAHAYKYSLTSLKIKLGICALFAVMLFFFENISLFGVQFAGALDPAVYPVVYIMVSLQLMLLACAVAYEQIFTGIRNLFTAQPTPESITAVLTVLGILYSVFVSITAEQGVEPIMYNFAVAACALMTLFFAYLNTKREIFSFNIISSKKPKYVFRRIPSSEASPESEAFGALDEDNPDVLQIERAAFVDGYFGRTTEVLKSTRIYITAMMSVVPAAALLLAVISAGSGAVNAVSIAYVAILAAIPMSVFFTYSYPLYKANREAYEMDSTIVGDSSVEEYAGAAIISFDDRNVFPSIGVKVQNIKIEPRNRIDRILYYAASVFSAAGGPLCDVFDVATNEIEHSSDVKILSAGIGYLEASVDGRKILFGRSAVLTELGIEIPEEVVEEDSYIEGDLCIMYMIRDGKYVAKMYIKYIMDADFEFIVRQFANNGTCVCVKTLDPNIDEGMIFSKIKGKKYPLKVVKLYDGDSNRERAESGIVTRGSTKSLLQVVSLCDMILSVRRTNMIVSVIAAVVTLAIMLIVAISNNLGALGSWLIVANQLFWTIPAVLVAKLYIK